MFEDSVVGEATSVPRLPSRPTRHPSSGGEEPPSFSEGLRKIVASIDWEREMKMILLSIGVLSLFEFWRKSHHIIDDKEVEASYKEGVAKTAEAVSRLWADQHLTHGTSWEVRRGYNESSGDKSGGSGDKVRSSCGESDGESSGGKSGGGLTERNLHATDTQSVVM